MTAIVANVAGASDACILKNVLQFDVSYSEIKNTYQNESGKTITYAVRNGKRTIALKIEANTEYLHILLELLNQTQIHLKYMDGMYSESDCTGITSMPTQEGDFIKSSDIKIARIADARVSLCNAGCHSPAGGCVDRFGRGAYEVSVTLEEV